MKCGTVLSILLGVAAVVSAQDANWGKKVQCFTVDGTVVCPGCNQRAGLSCPRSLRDPKNSCLLTTTESSKSTRRSTFRSTEAVTTPTTVAQTTSSPSSIATVASLLPRTTRNPLDMAIFLYRILGPRFASEFPVQNNRNRWRNKRYVKQQQVEEKGGNDDDSICNWNGDCPCPLICCKTGEGCPKRCVMGIRLPPPWG